MRYRKYYRVTYFIKNDEGYIVEHRNKFVTMNEALSFLRDIKRINLVGKPILESK